MELEDFEPIPQPRRGRVRVWEHGTEAAMARHDRAGEPLCEECEERRSEVWREKNERRRARR